MVECLNAGFSAQFASELYSIYTGELIKYQPDYIILNLSFNDVDTDEYEFRESLQNFIALNSENNIETIFSLEAASIETDTRKLQSKHMIMREIADENRVPVLDLHGHLAEYYDTGFLWWDAVHLTSYGHLLAGEFMAENVKIYISGSAE